MGTVIVIALIGAVVFGLYKLVSSIQKAQDNAISAAERTVGKAADYKNTWGGGVLAAFIDSKKLLAGEVAKNAKVYGAAEVKSWTVEWVEKSQNGRCWKTDFKLRIDLNNIDTPFFRVGMASETEAYRWSEILNQTFA